MFNQRLIKQHDGSKNSISEANHAKLKNYEWSTCGQTRAILDVIYIKGRWIWFQKVQKVNLWSTHWGEKSGQSIQWTNGTQGELEATQPANSRSRIVSMGEDWMFNTQARKQYLLVTGTSILLGLIAQHRLDAPKHSSPAVYFLALLPITLIPDKIRNKVSCCRVFNFKTDWRYTGWNWRVLEILLTKISILSIPGTSKHDRIQQNVACFFPSDELVEIFEQEESTGF